MGEARALNRKTDCPPPSLGNAARTRKLPRLPRAGEGMGRALSRARDLRRSSSWARLPKNSRPSGSSNIFADTETRNCSFLSTGAISRATGACRISSRKKSRHVSWCSIHSPTRRRVPNYWPGAVGMTPGTGMTAGVGEALGVGITAGGAGDSTRDRRWRPRGRS